PSPAQSWCGVVVVNTPLGPAELAGGAGKQFRVPGHPVPTNPPANPTAVSLFVSNISTPPLLRSAKYSFCVTGSNQLMSTLQRAFGLASRARTMPSRGVGDTVFGGGGTWGMRRPPPSMTQLDVFLFPLTPKLVFSSARTEAVLLKNTADINQEHT